MKITHFIIIALLFISSYGSENKLIKKGDLDITQEELRDRKIVTQGGLQFNPLNGSVPINEFDHTGYTTIGVGNTLPWKTKKLHYVTYNLMMTITGMKERETNSDLIEAKSHDGYHLQKGYDAYVGSYVNYQIALSKAFRPGIIIGFGYRREFNLHISYEPVSIFNPYNLPSLEAYDHIEYSWEAKPVLGLSFQFGPVYANVTSHEGFGIGFCSGMKRRIEIHNNYVKNEKRIKDKKIIEITKK